ncbi:hypothetical protein FH972_024342 [Carpinus fangiana]|uniref:Protein pelota homolog n=1 Tax=Carpinus fangiana TaxID=176857 RepID=A0A5N6L0A3_9ROSI|nr:hypothetical protein FH972_024342 [Carpinus fangiana]
MRLVKRSINENEGTGSVVLLPTEPEDMWHLYNLIRPHDLLRAPAIRKVTDTAGTGSTVSRTVRTTFTIRVKSLDFDPHASELHVSGIIAEENEVVSMGRHHTLDLELQRQFTLTKDPEDKGGDGWDSVALHTLKEATDIRKQAEVYAVVMQEGLANICVITEHQTILRQRVEASIPRKRAGHGGEAHDKGLAKFFDTLQATLLRHLDVDAMMAEERRPPLLLASPGFVAQGFQKHLASTALKEGNKILGQYVRESVLVAHSSSGHVHSLAEVLKQPAVLTKLSDTKYARESQALEKFMELLREDDGRAWYGPREVERAVEKGAVGRGGGVLLISNGLFRSYDIAERRKWVQLVEQVQKVEGGEVRVLSSAHESGKRLEGLGGIGAILTYPLQDLDEDDPDDTEAIPVAARHPEREAEDVAGALNL